MKWYLLKQNRCPKCGGDFTDAIMNARTLPSGDKVYRHKCEFRITEKRYKEIVGSMVRKDIEELPEKTHKNELQD